VIQRFAVSDWCEAVRFSLIVVSIASPDGEFPEVIADRYDDPNADVNLQLTKDFKLSQVRPRGPAR